jgi:hypothetical protein
MFVFCLEYLTKHSSVLRGNRHLSQFGENRVSAHLRSFQGLMVGKLAMALAAFLLISVTGLTVDVQGQGSAPLFESPWRGYDTGALATVNDPGGFGPGSIASGDLDGDGDSDMLVGNHYAGRPGLSILKNAGDGTYSWPTFYTLPDNKSVGDVALSDVDGDGDLDALATVPDLNGMSNVLALWRNNGDGTFTKHVEFATGPGPVGLVVADLNGDGFSDVATANHGYVSGQNNTISVLRHNGLTGASAGFVAPAEFSVNGIHALRITAADLNGDRRIDLVVGGRDLIVVPGKPNGGRLGVLLNNGAGGFTVSATYESVPGSRLPTGAVALADLDNDGDADLVGGGLIQNGSVDNGAISVRRNSGNGTFGSPEIYLFENSVDRPQNFALGDLNSDGFTDIVGCSPTGRSTDGWVALLSNGSGGFLPAVRYEASQQTVDATLTDTDRDGDLDVVTVAKSSAAITVHRNAGNGVFAVLPRNHVGQVSNPLEPTQALEAGDVDRDGDLDLVTNDEKVYVLKNNGNGTFATAVAYEQPHNFGEVKLRDLNGDGYLDLLLGPDRNAPPYHFGTALNNGDGTFAPGVIKPVGACQAGSIDAFDLDGDNDLDVVLTEEGSCAGGPGFRIFIFRNDGQANFTFIQPLNPPCGPSGIGGGDLNGDGRVDLVTGHCTGVGAFLGNGDLTFQPILTTSAMPSRFKLADMNRDGKLDVAMILSQPPWGTATIGTALGNGDGTFAPARTQSGSSVLENLRISNDIDVADADEDGDPDLIVTNNASNDLSLLLNNGDGSLRAQERYGVGYAPMFSAFADFTGDGRADVASTIGVLPAGLKSAVVILRNLGTDTLIGEPQATITSPANGATYTAPATIHIAADVQPVGNRSITKVEFYLGDGKGSNPKLIHTDTVAPYGGFDLINQGVGTYSLYAFAYDSEGVGISVGVLYEVKVPKTTPIITWNNPLAITYGAALGSTQLNATANVPGSFAYNPVAGTKLNAGNNQTLSVNFTPTDTANYTSASKSVLINVLKANQTITFNPLPSKTFGNAPFALSATSSSGLPVSFQIVSGPATISGNTVTINGVGTVTVRASQAGNSNYNAAAFVDRAFEVVSAGANVTLANLSHTYDGTAKFATATTNPAGKSVTFTYSQNGVSVTSPINAGAYTVKATITDPGFQGTATGTLVINKATPVIAWTTPAYIMSGTSLGNAQLTATANMPGVFQYTPAAGTALGVGTHQLSVTFTPTDAVNYHTATASVQLTVVANPFAPNNPIETNDFFVRQHYLDFLDREPEADGFKYWTSILNGCGTDEACLNRVRVEISSRFFIELEFQRTGYYVMRMYQASYGHPPTYAQFVADRRQVQNSPESQKLFASQWAERADFLSQYPASLTPAQFVAQLYNAARMTDPAAQAAAEQGLINQTKTRADVLWELVERADYQAREYNPAFVRMQYFGYLRREVEADGFNYWMNVLTTLSPNNYRSMICGFVNAGEYQLRFNSTRGKFTELDCNW